MQRLTPRLQYYFVDGATAAASIIAKLTGVPLGDTRTGYELSVLGRIDNITAGGGPEPPSWSALAAGRQKGTKHWGALAYNVQRENELEVEQIERARSDSAAAARVDSGREATARGQRAGAGRTVRFS